MTFKHQNEVILLGSKMPNSLYLLNLKPIESASRPFDVASSSPDWAFGASLRTTWKVWHERLGHTSYHTMRRMIQLGLVIGMNGDGDCTIPECSCVICELGKFHKLPFVNDPKTPVSRIGELICADSWGPIKEKSLGGASYFISFKDDFSGSLHVYFMKRKSEGPAHLRLYSNMLLNQTGNHILTLRTDNGGEFVNNENKLWCEERGIRHETSAPYTPQQNGIHPFF